MYLRHSTREKDGKAHTYWRLVRCVRRGSKVVQETVAQLGELDAEGRARARLLARRITGRGEQRELFEEEVSAETVPIRVDQVRIERSRRFGEVYLAWTLWRGLELEKRLGELLPHKEALETHLRSKLGELLELDYDLLLYDVTSTYFEGLSEANDQAQRGYSRDHRGDCKQVCLALVVTREGMPLGYEVFSGNRVDVTTVEEIVGTMEERFGVARRIWVMDRGMVSQANVEWLQTSGRRYLLGASRAELETLKKRLETSRSRLDRSTIDRQIGRLLERSRRAARRFEIELVEDGSRPSGLRLSWIVRNDWDEWAQVSEGCYGLRTNVADWTPEQLWQAYIQLTQAEAAFRIQKSDLALRPIWHQKKDRVQAHILVCFLAYVLWKTLEQWARRAGLGTSARTILHELAGLTSADVVLPTAEAKPRQLRLRCVVRPDPARAALLNRLGIRLPERLRPHPL